MTAFERFAVVRVPFPFTDRQAQKRRPALVLSLPDFQQACGHVLLVMIPPSGLGQHVVLALRLIGSDLIPGLSPPELYRQVLQVVGV